MPITKETKIEFTLGWFIGTVISVMGTMISVFTAFYFMVQKPNNDGVKDFAEKQLEIHQKYLDEKFGDINTQLSGFSSGISNLNTQIGELSRRDNVGATNTEKQGGGF